MHHAARRALLSGMAQQQPPQVAAAASAAAAAVAPALDRAAFRETLRVPALRVPTRSCHELMRKLRGFTLEAPRVKCIIHDGERPDVRLLLLKQDADAAPEVASVLQQHSDCEVLSHDVTLDYSHLSTEAVLRKLLPPGAEVPSSFESVGHIAHFNLRDELLPYKAVIGQVVLDKNPAIKTVVNKLGQIENEFRVFSMEIIAGEPHMETEVAQHGVRFRLDFSQVYWNSRLEAEHTRLVSLFQPGEAVADVMAGIGPFALPAGRKGCKVYANDLNPASAKYLNLNIQLNRVAQQVLPFNMDGRQFIRLLLATPGSPAEQAQPAQEQAQPAAEQPAQQPQQQPQQQQQQQQQQQAQQQPADAQAAAAPDQQQLQQQAQAAAAAPSPPRKQPPPKRRLVAEVPPPAPPGFTPPPGGVLFQHVVMNLPASAVEFLDAFRGAFDPQAWAGRLPLVHVYTFMKHETQQDVVRRVEAALGGALDAPPAIHSVRDVAPGKLMLCVTFRVPAAVAFAGRQGGASGAQQPAAANSEQLPAAKRPRT